MSPALRFLTANAWAMEPGVFDQLSDIVDRHALGVRLSPAQIAKVTGKPPRADDGEDSGDDGDETAMASEPGMEIEGDTAIIPIRGVIARYASQVNQVSQPQGRSAESLQADLKAVLQNDAVKSVILCIDSPGGTVAGTDETASLIRQVSAAGKHVIAYIDGMAASAAYWLASQADEIVCSAPTSQAGCIGVMAATVDTTKAQDSQGRRVTIIRSHPLKAPGAGGEKLSMEQLSSLQRNINDLADAFVQTVAAGRGLDGDALAAATTGEIFAASRAKSLGLVDSIESMDALIARVYEGGVYATAKLAAMQSALGWMSHTQKASAKTAEELTMAKSIEQMAALIEAHPKHAVMISKMAAKDATEEAIIASIASADAADKLAKIEADGKAKDEQIAKLTADLAAKSAEAIATAAELATAKTERDALVALKAGTEQTSKVKVDGIPPKPAPKAAQADYDKMTGREKAAFHREGGVIA